MRIPPILLGSLTICLFGASAAADQVTGTVVAPASDTPALYKASGTLTSVDTPVAAVPADPNATPPVPGTPAQAVNNGIDDSYTIPPAGAPSWSFQIRHGNPGGWQQNSAKMQICMEGQHLDGPHPADTDPNPLASLCSKVLKIKFGVANAKKRTVFAKPNHPIRGGGAHTDHLGFTAHVGLLPAATGNVASGIWQVYAKHDMKPKANYRSKLFSYSFGSSPDSGSTVAYDHETETLHFTVGAIDILDTEGGSSKEVAGDFLEDPFRSGLMTVGDLKLMERGEDGVYKFGPGTVLVTDPAENFELEGTFSEYVIDNTVGGETVTSYALLETVITDDLVERASAFLTGFVEKNLLGEAVPDETTPVVVGVDLTFLTSEDLATATKGFTVSAKLPTTILVALNSGQGISDETEDESGLGLAEWILLLGAILGALVVIVVVVTRRSRSSQ